MATSPPNFERSISMNDLDSSLRVRELVKGDILTPEDERKHSHLRYSSDYTFVLKSFKDLALDFKKFLYSYLLDVGIYKELEENKKLNWCQSLYPMVPVLTLGDGNCLMHAASIGMWAVNDRYHILRKLVYDAILEDTEGLFHKRWQREQELTNLRVHGYNMTEEQWNKEWEIVLQLVSQEEYPIGHHGMQYGSLEEIHIFVLANVLRRTIIVVSCDTLRGNYDESLSPVNFAGIYLPLNWDPVDCVKTPLVIGFAQGHFTAIVSFEDGVFDQGEAMDGVGQISEKMHGVPLQKHDGTLLPIHFLFANEENLADGLLRQYLDCKKLTYKDPEDGSLAVTLVAKMHFVPPPDSIKTLVEGFFTRARETYRHMVQTKEMQTAGGETPSLAVQQCITEGCEFHGTAETAFLCSKCLEKHLTNEENQAVIQSHNRETGLREEHAPTGIIKEAFSSAGRAGTTLREEIPLRTTEQQQQTMALQQQQQQQWQQAMGQNQQTIGAIELQQQREFELIEQEQQQKRRDLQQQKQKQEYELVQRQQQQREFETMKQRQQEKQQLRELEQQQQQRREFELMEQQRQQQQREQQQQQEQQKLRDQEQERRELELIEQQRKQQQREQQQQHELQQLRDQEQQRRELIEQRRQQQQLGEQQQQQQRQQQQQTTAVLQQRQYENVQLTQQPKKCITNGCKYNAAAETGDLCYRCHEAETLAERQTESMISLKLQSKLCANSVNGCEYYGVPHQDDLCSRCYRNFCLEMESNAAERNTEVPPRSEDASLPPEEPGADGCQTTGCPNTGFPELYGKCVQCYSRCIKDFITSNDRLPLGGAARLSPTPQPSPSPQSAEPQPSASPRPLTSPQPSPGPSLPQASPLPQDVLPSHLGQTSAKKSAFCIFPGCQNKGVPSHGGRCTECYNIQPMNAEHYVSMATKTRESNVSSNTTPTLFAPTVTAGLPCGTPAYDEKCQRLFCKTPKCNNPVKECSLCTKCIMARYQQEKPSSSGEPGPRTTEAHFSRENLEAGLGATGFGMEKVGQNELQGSASEERRKAIASAREKLTPLQMPPSSSRTGLNPPQAGSSANTPGANIQCVAPNCTFYGNAEHNYYCSRCFEKNREEWKKINADLSKARRTGHDDHLVQEPLTRDPRVVTQKPNKIRACALKFCYNLETPGNNGLCDRCYRTAITSEKEWQLTNRVIIESQRQPPIHVLIPTSPPIGPAAATAPPATTTSPTRSARPLKKVFINAGAPCKTQGCLKFGTPAQQGLCDPCYEKLQKKNSTSASASTNAPAIVCKAQQRTSQPTNWSKGPFMQGPGVTTTFSAQDPIPVTQQSNTRFTSRLSNRCKQEGCKLTGAPEYGGYCSQCFAEYTRQSSYPESIPDVKDSPKVQDHIPSSTTLSVNNLNLTSTPTTSTTTVTGGLTTLEPGTPRVCAMEGCENIVTPRTMKHCRNCVAKYYSKISKKP